MPEAVPAQKFDFPHNDNQVSREYAYDWFNRVFKLGQPEPVRERPFVPVPPAQLHVFDACASAAGQRARRRRRAPRR